MNNSNENLIKDIKLYFEKALDKQNNMNNIFSDDVVMLAYNKISENIQDVISSEEDPLVLTEILKNYLELTKIINDKDIQKQQVMLKFFDQLVKYDQSRYF